MTETATTATRTDKIDAGQHLEWLLVRDLEMAPGQWGRPLREGDIRAIATNLDPDKLGAIAVWSRPKLPAQHGKYTVIDGQHRVAALRLAGYGDQRVPCLIYENLTIESAAELSLGLQERRNLHPLDKHRAALAAHDRRATEIDKVMTTLAMQLTYSANADQRRRITAISTLNSIWDRMGSVERVLRVCDAAWDGTRAAFGSSVMKLVMIVLSAHEDIDDARLAHALGSRSPGQWTAQSSPKRTASQYAQDVVVEYNKRARGMLRVEELTPSQYAAAMKRTPMPTMRGVIDGRKTVGKVRRRGRTDVRK